MKIEPFSEERAFALTKFLTAYYSHIPMKSDLDFFDWKFRENPLGNALNRYFLAVDGEEIVGQIAGIPDRLWVGSTWHPCAWAVDLAVNPGHRNAHAGLHLLRRAMAEPGVLLASGVCRGLLDLYTGLGWKKLRISETYYSILQSAALVRVISQNNDNAVPGLLKKAPQLTTIADTILPKLISSYRWFGSVPDGIYFEPLEKFETEVDALVESVLVDLGTTSYRSAEHLTWKVHRPPYGSYFSLAARSKNSSDLRGYVVVKEFACGDVKWADIVDVLVHREDSELFRALVREAHTVATRRGAGLVRLRCSLPDHTSKLRLPYWLMHTRPVVDEVMVYCRDKAMMSELERNRWHLTGIVSDRVDDGREEKNRNR